MKTIKLIISILLINLFFISCESDGGTSVIDLRIGAVPNIEKLDGYDTTISYSKLLQGQDFNIGVKMEIAQGDVTSADLIGFYNTAGGDTYGPVTLSEGISTFPVETTFDKSQIVAAFSELTTPDDIQFGDQLVISAKLYLADGTSIDMLHSDASRNYGSDIHTSGQYNVKVSYDVVCDFDPALTQGSYHLVSTDWAIEGDVTLTADPNDPYKILINGIWLLETYGAESNNNAMVISINPSDFSISSETVKLGPNAPWGPYTNYYYTATGGVYKSCDGAFEINFKITVDEGSFGEYGYVLTKN